MQISKAVIDFLTTKLSSRTHGVNAALANLRRADAHSAADISSFANRNVSGELLEKVNQAVYPGVLVYCEKFSNTQREKFRTFSGTVKLAIELRNSDDRVEALDHTTSVYVDAICGVLDAIRGTWTDHVMYDGTYEVTYSAAKAGGKHFVQSTKITLAVDVSR